LRFALGTRYGGDSIDVTVQRGDEKIQRTLTLADTLPPFRHAFLGILPLRPAAEPNNGETRDPAEAAADSDADDTNDEVSPGVAVRMVYPGSPAEKAGVLAGDRVLEIGGVPVRSIENAITEMNNHAPGSEVAVRLGRGGQLVDLKLSAAGLPSNVPSELPRAIESTETNLRVGSQEPESDLQGSSNDKSAESTLGEDSRPQATGRDIRDVKLPEFRQECKIYVPASHEAGQPQGLLLWIQDGDPANAEELIRRWQSICDRDGLLLAVPTPAEAKRWDRTELEYLVRLVTRMMNQYKVDPRRIVVYGQANGGTMAWSLGFLARSAIRGLSVSAAPLPRRMTVPANEPSQRLAIFAAMSTATNLAIAATQGLQKCSDAGYPVTALTLGADSGDLAEQEREEFARWIDTLDRF
jgi:hypothetical protein